VPLFAGGTGERGEPKLVVPLEGASQRMRLTLCNELTTAGSKFFPST
jgi:hypothetical protein